MFAASYFSGEPLLLWIPAISILNKYSSYQASMQILPLNGLVLKMMGRQLLHEKLFWYLTLQVTELVTRNDQTQAKLFLTHLCNGGA